MGRLEIRELGCYANRNLFRIFYAESCGKGFQGSPIRDQIRISKKGNFGLFPDCWLQPWLNLSSNLCLSLGLDFCLGWFKGRIALNWKVFCHDRAGWLQLLTQIGLVPEFIPGFIREFI